MAESRTLPVLPLRDIVVYPKMAAPLFVGREKSVRALDEVMRKDKQILLAGQMDASEDEPSTDRIFTIGTVATVVQLLKLPDGTVRVLVEGGYRARIKDFHENDSFFEVGGKSFDALELVSRIRTTFRGDIPIQALLRAPTVTGMTGKVRDFLAGREGTIE